MADERFQDFPQKTNPIGSDELVGVDGSGYFRAPVSSLPSSGGGSSSVDFFDSYKVSGEPLIIEASGDSNMTGFLQFTPVDHVPVDNPNILIWQADSSTSGAPDNSTVSWKRFGTDVSLSWGMQDALAEYLYGMPFGSAVQEAPATGTVPRGHIAYFAADELQKRRGGDVYLYICSKSGTMANDWISPNGGYDANAHASRGFAAALAAAKVLDNTITAEVPDLSVISIGGNDSNFSGGATPVDPSVFAGEVQQRYADLPVLDAKIKVYAEPPLDTDGTGQGPYYNANWDGWARVRQITGTEYTVVSGANVTTADTVHLNGDSMHLIGARTAQAALIGDVPQAITRDSYVRKYYPELGADLDAAGFAMIDSTGMTITGGGSTVAVTEDPVTDYTITKSGSFEWDYEAGLPFYPAATVLQPLAEDVSQNLVKKALYPFGGGQLFSASPTITADSGLTGGELLWGSYTTLVDTVTWDADDVDIVLGSAGVPQTTVLSAPTVKATGSGEFKLEGYAAFNAKPVVEAGGVVNNAIGFRSGVVVAGGTVNDYSAFTALNDTTSIGNTIGMSFRAYSAAPTGLTFGTHKHYDIYSNTGHPSKWSGAQMYSVVQTGDIAAFGSFTVTTEHHIVEYDNTAGAAFLILPTATAELTGMELTFKVVGSSTVACTFSGTLDGDVNPVWTGSDVEHTAVTMYCTDTEWRIISRYDPS